LERGGSNAVGRGQTGRPVMGLLCFDVYFMQVIQKKCELKVALQGV
jgi:hypothetical protein